MKIDFSKTFTELDGSELKFQGKTLTFGAAAAQALLHLPNGENPESDEKVKRNSIAEKICNGGEVDLSLEEASLVKACCNSLFGVRIMAQISNMLN